MRVALTETFWRRITDSELVAFARNYSVFVYERGTEDEAAIWSEEEGGVEVAQPLLTDDGGRARGDGDVIGWVAAASYDIVVNGVRIPWEAAKGGAGGGGGAVNSVNGEDGDVTLGAGDVGAATPAEVEAEESAREAADAAHAADTTSVHGIADTAALALKSEILAPIPAINAKVEGAKGDGSTDDTAALQAAIDKAIAQGWPLYLPPGEYRTTAGLDAEADNFVMEAAGTRLSTIVPDSSAYDTLVIGPAEGNAGNDPSGYARDFGFKGGDADVTAAGTEPDTGKAALKLRGMTLFAVERVAVLEDSDFDIGFDLVNNCFGVTFRHIRTGFNSCRVGLNLRTGPESGSDITVFNPWLAGEVAAVHIGPDGGGFHFYGGQMSSSNGSAEEDDDRGTVIGGKEYTSGATGRSSTCTFDGIDFEGAKHCWVMRTFDEVSFTIRECAFNADDEGVPMIGAFKGTDFKNSRLVLTNVNVSGQYTADVEDMVSISGDFGGRSLIEHATSGEADVGDGSISFNDIPLLVAANEGNAFAFGSTFFLMNGMLVRREDEEPLEYATEWELKLEGEDLEIDATWNELSGATPNAAAVSYAGASGMSASNVETAIDELAGETYIRERTVNFKPGAAELMGLFRLRVPSGFTAKLTGLVLKTTAGTCKVKVKRTTSGGSESEPLKEKEAKTGAPAEHSPASETLADKDLIEVLSEGAATGLVLAQLEITYSRS